MFFKFPIRISDIRISQRVLRSEISVQSFGPLYNELNNEIDSDLVKKLDSSLSIGHEIKQVYEELFKTVDEDFLSFDLVIFIFIF